MQLCPTCQRCYEDQDLACPETNHEPLTFQRVGTRVIGGRYRLDKLQGSGGNGAVYRAIHLELNRLRAIKLQRFDRNDGDPSGGARLRREASIASELDHPNIVRVYDFGTNVVSIHEQGHTRTESELFITMELLEGRTLDQYTKRNGPLPPEDALLIAQQIAEGLAELHAHGVIHRDLKPANVMLTIDRHGELIVKIIDLGTVKHVDTEVLLNDLNLTGGVFIGSYPYASPEMCRHDPLTMRSDLYSLGLILYEMLAGRRAFGSNLLPELVFKQTFEEPPPLVGIQEPLVSLVAEMLKKDPTQRLQSATEFIERCAEFERVTGLDCRDSSRIVTSLREAGFQPNIVTAPVDVDEETIWSNPLVQATVLSLDPSGVSVSLENGATAIIPWGEFQPNGNEKLVSPVKPGQRVQAMVQPNGNGNGLAHLAGPVTIFPDVSSSATLTSKNQDVPRPKQPKRRSKEAKPEPTKLTAPERTRVVIAVLFLVAFASLSIWFIVNWLMRPKPAADIRPAVVVSSESSPQPYVSQVGDEAETTTDVNIREKHNVHSRKVGLAEKGSRVRVLEVHRNWRRILVLDHGREKEDESSEEEGWIAGENLKRVDGGQI